MTDRLTESDKKHWHPPANLTAWIADQIPEGARVLDVGAGILPFPRADVLIDIAQPNAMPHQQWIKSDVIKHPLPFADKSFDFVYCRHVLEDVHEPFGLIREMERVGNAGYIETPSPMAELCRGVDGSSPPWRGYYHHHYIVWAHLGELRFVAKYPLVEYLNIPLPLAARLKAGPRYWNTHLLWQDKIAFRHRQSLVDFHLFTDYGLELGQAIEQATASCEAFWAGIPLTDTLPLIGLPSAAA